MVYLRYIIIHMYLIELACQQGKKAILQPMQVEIMYLQYRKMPLVISGISLLCKVLHIYILRDSFLYWNHFPSSQKNRQMCFILLLWYKVIQTFINLLEQHFHKPRPYSRTCSRQYIKNVTLPTQNRMSLDTFYSRIG